VTRLAIALACAAAAAGAGAAAATPSLPFDEVRAGQRGVGRTVFAGDTVEEFEVEIIGKLEKIGPGRNVILARLAGGPLEETGVLAGMSGSPVLVDGKLVGAIAFTWGFAKEPIAGITPIEEMRGDAGRPLRGTRLEAGAAPWTGPPPAIAALDPLPLARRLSLVRPGASVGPGLAAAPPLFAAAGFAPAAHELLAAALPRGVTLVPGGAASPEESTGAAGLRPGEVVGVRLVDGDLELSAFGTVTEVDAERVLAFGHPLLGLGEIDVPMTRGRVETLFPSLSYSFKVASAGAEVGAFLADLPSGASGRVGARPRMVPVRVEVPSEGGRTWSYRVASDPLLTPPLLFLTLASLAEESRPGTGAATFRLREGSTLLLEDGRQVDLPFFITGDQAGLITSAVVAIVSQLLLRNEFEPASLAGINLILEHSPGRLEAEVVDLVPHRSVVRPGETLPVSVHLQPWRGEKRTETLELEIPAHLSPGQLTLVAGDALRLAMRETREGPRLRPRSLDELIHLLNNLRSLEHLYLVGIRREPAAAIGASIFPDLPPSRSLALVPPGEETAASRPHERSVLEESVSLGLTPRGLRRATVTVLPARGEP
jgi:hypothetical protein